MAADMEQVARMIEPENKADLIEACKQGDREAFHSLFEIYKDKVYSIAYHYSGEEAMARDVTLQGFLKLFTSISQFRQDSEFTTWLYRIVANAFVDDQRKRMRIVPLSAEIEVCTMAA